MFQDYALFPHMNVFDNIAFCLRMNHLEKSKIEQRVQEVLALVGTRFSPSGRFINLLSGGEQQRWHCALTGPPTPFAHLDEPLGALDRTLRERLVYELGDILHQLHQTAIYVTHDQEEDLRLCRPGRIIETPEKWNRSVHHKISIINQHRNL
jgi:ABC-type Fe3+/spermidine/putrescine transport system ATPase subunit